MELDNFLYKIQGALKNEEKAIGPLYLVNKENEEAIAKVEESVKKVFADRPQDADEKFKVQLYFLLVLNTNIEPYNSLKKNRKCAHLVGFFPKISQDIFIRIIFALQLNTHLYESMKHFSSVLSFHLLEICLKSLKWIDLFEAVSFTENILLSLFNRLVKEDDKEAKYSVHLKDVFQRLLLHYDTEKGGSLKRMGSWKSSKLKHYAGVVMASLLRLVEQCTKIYCKKETIAGLEDYSLYNIQIENEAELLKILPNVCNSSITVWQCYEHIVARCLQNVCDITIDLWLFWVEIDLDEIPDTENTLQKLVGENAYMCQEALKEAECMGVSSKESSDLISRLKNIAIRPTTEEDQAASLNLEKILENIQNPEKDTAKWIKFLLTNPSFVVDSSALEMLSTRVFLLQDSDIVKLSKTLFQFIKSNPENCASHKAFIFEMTKQCDTDCQVDVLGCFVETCGLTEILKQEEFQPIFVETFNRVINEEDKEKELYPQFVSLALQDARAVVRRAVTEGITSEVRGHLMADVLGRLQAFCDALLPSGNPLLVVALDELLLTLPDLPENQRMNYPLFVRELVMRKNLNGEQFIKNCLMEKIHYHMKTKNWILSSACLETLSELLDMDCVLNCPATLVMLLQVVEASRCQPSSFTMASMQVCQLALQLVPQFVSKWYDQGVEDKHLKNLTAMVHRYISPLNRFHLYRLLTDESLPSDPALQLMYRTQYGIGEWSVLNISPNERHSLVYALCFVLPTLTASEWQEMFCVVAPKCSEFLALFHIVTDSLLLCFDSAKVKSDNQTVISCLNYAILNIAQVVKDELNRWTKDDNEYRISVLSKMCQLLSNLPPDRQESFGLSLVKVLQQLLPEGSRRKPLTAEEMNMVTVSIGSIKSSEVRQNLAREFLEMVHR